MTEVMTFTPSGDVFTLVGGGIPGPAGRDGEAAQVKALGSFYAALARRTSPVRILFLGSSSTYGSNATTPDKRWVNRVVRRIQISYPSSTGVEAAITTMSAAAGSPNTNPGVQGLNAGISGATSATYYSSATLYGTGILNPDLAIHMIGSNDSTEGQYYVPVAQYKANVIAAIDGLDNQSTSGTPICHLLVHTYRRYGVTEATWKEYGEALKQIADSRPNVAFLDISQEYENARHISPDPYNLIDTDIVHQTDAGHEMMADIVLRYMGFGPVSDNSRPVANGLQMLPVYKHTAAADPLPSGLPVPCLVVTTDGLRLWNGTALTTV